MQNQNKIILFNAGFYKYTYECQNLPPIRKLSIKKWKDLLIEKI